MNFRKIQISCFFKRFVKYFFCFVILGITAQFIEKTFLKFRISLSDHMTSVHTLVLILFNREGKAQRKNQMGKFALFQS